LLISACLEAGHGTNVRQPNAISVLDADWER